MGVHAREEAAQRRDAVALADAEHRDVDVGRAGLERAERVRDRAAGVVVAVELDVAVHHAAQRAHQVEHLARVGDAHGVGDADAVDADAVDRVVDGEQVDQVAAEGVLGREADLELLALDEVDDLDRRLDDLGNLLAVRELAQQARGAEQDVDAVDAGLDRDARVLHRAARVGEDLRLQAQVGDGLAVAPAARARRRRGHLEVLDAELVEHLRDGHLLLGGEEGVGELLALAQGGFDDRVLVEAHARCSVNGRSS